MMKHNVYNLFLCNYSPYLMLTSVMFKASFAYMDVGKGREQERKLWTPIAYFLESKAGFGQ